MKPRKTTEQWLNTLKEEHRDAALANIFEDSRHNLRSSLDSALFADCKWGHSPQGEGYWGAIYEQILNGTYFEAPQHTAEGFEAKAKAHVYGLPEDSEKRKEYPIYTGLVCYFGDALAEVANLSFQGNQQHHPEKPLHWDQSKSTDSRDALMRHIFDMERANKALDHETEFEEAKRVAWRGLENLQRLIENKCQYTTK